MFFLPLPFNKTVNTIDDIKNHNQTTLPNQELYIVINGKPTKSKVIWHSLVNVSNIRVAIKKVKEINWLYKNIDNRSLDRASNEIIECALNPPTPTIHFLKNGLYQQIRPNLWILRVEIKLQKVTIESLINFLVTKDCDIM